MDKKPFDPIENRIREAADNSSQYPFEEKAWSRMETMLDKGKKRRAIVWWWALPALLLIGTGVYSLYHYQAAANVSNQQLIAKNTTDNRDDSLYAPDEKIPARPKHSMSVRVNRHVSFEPITETAIQQQGTHKAVRHLQVAVPMADIALPVSTDVKQHKYGTGAKMRLHMKTNEVDTDSAEAKINNEDVVIAAVPGDSTNKSDAVKQENKKAPIKKDTTSSLAKIAQPVKPKHQYRFYALAMGGPDAPDVNFLSFDKTTIAPRFGIGIGYQLNDRWSIQTGFYAGHKEYIAGPGDYTAKAGSYYSTVDITKVAANCLVYDIPVTVRYNFILGTSTIYYATAGISSFIMKNEAYNYNYIDNGTSYQSAKTYTGNQSLFSVFDLSVGVDRQLSNRFSLELEPSVSIPLAGVGAGSVRLYSTSLLIGVKYKF